MINKWTVKICELSVPLVYKRRWVEEKIKFKLNYRRYINE